MSRLSVAILALPLLTAPALASDLQGHRGARGLAPENTLPAFLRALAIGVTTLELDTGVTADGRVIVAEAKSLGLRIVPWTVNEPDDLRAVIALGVDGLITDYPDRAKDILASLGIIAAQ